VVVDAQSFVPQAQSAPLAALPFVFSQVGTALQRPPLVDVSQNSPVVMASQSAVPQVHVALLIRVPSMFAQGTKSHRLSLAKQNSPVVDVQAPAAPQTQGAGLAVAPSLWEQTGPVKVHRQALEEE